MCNCGHPESDHAEVNGDKVCLKPTCPCESYQVD